MSYNNAYTRGWNRTMASAGLEKVAFAPSEPTPSGTITGMAAGASLGGRAGETLAQNSKKELLGIPIPFTEKVDPNTASTVGSILGALAGGYAGHNWDRKTKGRKQQRQSLQTLPPGLYTQ